MTQIPIALVIKLTIVLFFQELFTDLQKSVKTVNAEHLKRILSFGFAIQQADGKISLPDFPLDSMYALVRIMANNSSMDAYQALNRLYPYRLLLPKEGIESVSNLFQSLNIDVPKEGGAGGNQRIVSINRDSSNTGTSNGGCNARRSYFLGLIYSYSNIN